MGVSITNTFTNCPNCGAPYEHGLDHCQYCGTPYPLTVYRSPEMYFDPDLRLVRSADTDAVITEKIETLKAVLDTPPIHPLTIFNSPELHLDPNTHLVRSAEREADLKQIRIRLQELQAQADTNRKSFEEEQKAKREADKKFGSWCAKEKTRNFFFSSCCVFACVSVLSVMVATFVHAAGFQHIAEQIVNIGFLGGLTLTCVLYGATITLDYFT